VLVLGYWLVAALLILAEYYAGWTEPSSRWDAVAFLGYFKISISLIKYVPQVYWNWVRKSTSGWSIVNIVLDFTGGLFSFLQLILTRIDGDPNPLNLVKVALGLISMGFDVVFILQHYVWYR
jgi:cystinosin